ncbi:hypothetical protein DN402_32850 [Streptomyces sp. SW4]|nr:hypothetical protein DN402_32850 [Streptomyces sp. SW4]
MGPLLAAAAADARGDAGLDAAVRLERARRALRDADGERGLVELAAAERRARDAGDPELLAEILGLVGIVTMQNDPAQALRTLDEALGLAAGLPLCPATVTVRLSWSVAQARDGRVSPAVAVLEALREEAEAAGCVQQLCTVLYVAAAVNSRAGRCRQAAQHARTAAELRAASEPGPGPALAMRGVAELEAGSAPAAARHLDAAVERCTAAEDTEWLAYSLGWRGRARLLLGRYADAAEDLERCRALLDSLGFVDPALFLADADLVESLALAGRHGPARRALARARDRVAALDRHVVTLGLDRAEAVLVGSPIRAEPRRCSRPRCPPPTPIPWSRRGRC